MFKIILAVTLLAVIQCQLAGGFTDRPDLIESVETQNMVKLAVNQLAATQNLRVSTMSILSVATQVVNGVNYRITFTARPYTSAGLYICTAKIYKSFAGQQSVSTVECS